MLTTTIIRGPIHEVNHKARTQSEADFFSIWINPRVRLIRMEPDGGGGSRAKGWPMPDGAVAEGNRIRNM